MNKGVMAFFCGAAASAAVFCLAAWNGNTQPDQPAAYAMMCGESGVPNVNSIKYIMKMNTATGESWYLRREDGVWVKVTDSPQTQQ